VFALCDYQLQSDFKDPTTTTLPPWCEVNLLVYSKLSMWAIGASRFKFTAAAASVGTGYLCFRLNEPEGSVRAAHMASGYKITSPNQTLPRIDATLPVKPIDKLIDCSNPGSCPDKLMTLKDIEDGCNEGRIIVGFKGGVYDMTNFTGHPGGQS
jgi:hypothetical protein